MNWRKETIKDYYSEVEVEQIIEKLIEDIPKVMNGKDSVERLKAYYQLRDKWL